MGEFFSIFTGSFDVFMEGLWLTLRLSVVSLLIAIVIGLFFAMLKISRIKVLEIIADLYIWIVRGTPLIVQIFILFYGLAEIWLIPEFWAASIGLAFHSGPILRRSFAGRFNPSPKVKQKRPVHLG